MKWNPHPNADGSAGFGQKKLNNVNVGLNDPDQLKEYAGEQ